MLLIPTLSWLGNGYRLNWPSVAGKQYVIQSRSSPTQPWVNRATIIDTGTWTDKHARKGTQYQVWG